MGEMVDAGGVDNAEQIVLSRPETGLTGQRQRCSGAGDRVRRVRRDKAEEAIREPLALRRMGTYDMR